MALTQRFFRLFQADLHGVLDRLEEPEILLKHALREMEDELENSEQTLKQFARESQGIARRQAELSESQDRTDEELNLCFEANNESLARTLLKRKLEMEKLATHLARTQQELESNLLELRAQLAQNHEHYQSARQKAELLIQETTVNSASVENESNWRTHDFCVREDEVEIALLKEKQRRAELPGETP